MGCFPAANPAGPSAPSNSPKRLRDLGRSPAQSRSTALFHLGTELSAAILACMLGIHISVVAAWQRASAGDWTNHAAEVTSREPYSSTSTMNEGAPHR
ncbi:hypothetical protein [Mangrovihabitans endophyticus]|nr:hypothetical protein [Mangrovihabitans endophyticus]